MNYFIFRSINDVSALVPEWETILEKLGEAISEEEIWEVAKCNDDLPHFGNIYQDLLLSRIKYLTEEKFPSITVDFDVNSIASGLYLDNERIYDADTFIEKLEALEISDETENMED